MFPQHPLTSLKTLWTRPQILQYNTQQITETNLTIHTITPQYTLLAYPLTPIPHLNHQILFLIQLSKNYPITPPQIFAADSFITPSLKNYSDLLTPILKIPWQPTYRLIHLTGKIADFVQNLYKQKLKKRYINPQGNYHKHKFYNYSLLKQLSDHGPFISFEIQQETVTLYIITVTSFHFLLFKPQIQPHFHQHKLIVPKQEELQRMKIDFIADIQSLSSITHNRQHKHQFTFTFKGNTGNRLTFATYQKTLKIRKSEEMIETLLKSAKHHNMHMEADLLCVPKNSQEEHLLSQTRMHQQKVQHYFNKNSLNQLNHCYQKLVQYYSSVNLPYQQIYLQKMMQLHCREDVNLIMSTTSPKKQQPSP